MTTLFALPSYETLARVIARRAGVTLGRARTERFPNGEATITLSSSVREQSCAVLGSIAPPADNLVAFLLFCHTLKKEGARDVTALLPYLGYARQDKEEHGQSRAAAWIGEMLRASGVDRVLTIDVHSETAVRLLPMPCVSLSAAEFFARTIRREGLKGATIVAPDEGAVLLAEAVHDAARMSHRIAFFKKQRMARGVRHRGLHGTIGKNVVIIDDMLDTGGTLLSCCRELRKRDVQDIVVMVTHGLFTGAQWKRLWTVGVRRIWCTDTVQPRPATVSGRVTVLSVTVSLLADSLRVPQA